MQSNMSDDIKYQGENKAGRKDRKWRDGEGAEDGQGVTYRTQER